MFGIYGLKINCDNPVDPVQMQAFTCAESQAAPEKKRRILRPRAYLRKFYSCSKQHAKQAECEAQRVRSVLSAESQAMPESKGVALGHWQHGPREATSLLVSFTGTGWHVDFETRFFSYPVNPVNPVEMLFPRISASPWPAVAC